MSEANKALVRRYYEEVMGDLTGIDEVIAVDFVDHHLPPDLPPGTAGLKKFFIEHARSLFSDMRVEIEFMLAEADKVDCHFVFFARHTGGSDDAPATGNAIRLPAISTFRIADGKLAEAWEIYDTASLAQQMQ